MISLEDFYARSGGKSSEILGRLGGNETLLRLLLGKFPADPSFHSLEEALKNGKTQEAFREAHTLKGVAANLGLQDLFLKASEVTEFLRSEECDKAEAVMPELRREYDKVIALTAELK